MSLKERRELMALYAGAEASASGGVLMSLIQVAGSSYRRPGARLLVLGDGRTAGTLSGGCLEADLLRRASWTVRSGAVVEHISTAFDDTAEIPYGLGCGGEVDLLLESAGSPEAAALMGALQQSLDGQHRTVVTLLPGARALARIILDAHGDVLFASDALPTEQVVTVRSAARASSVPLAGIVDTEVGPVAIERLLPAQRLVIFGAGEDARPLARLALEMGWSVAVADTRAQRATAERFPGVQQVLVAAGSADVPVHPEDAVVLMTHSYEQDGRLLAELLPIAPRYLGLLGARHRSALLLQGAAESLGMPLATAVDRTHAPIGLELGGDGPESVALAIVAELQHTFSGMASQTASRRLTTAAAERLLAEAPPFVPRESACALYATDGQAVAP